jgi:cell division protein FtsZ
MLFEVEQAANRIRAEVDPDANIIFGNTILDEMEGRIRVSVVATGIDAEQMMLPEKKVTTLRTAYKAPMVKAAAPAPMPAPVPSPVHAQVEALAAELGAPAAAPSQAEDYILGGADAPEVPAGVIPASAARYTAIETVRRPEDMPLAPKPVEQKKGGWGLFGRKKAAPAADMRAEPQTTYPKPQAQRPANVQPIPAEKPAAPSDDLFPEHGSDEQFEIPAFLRRQGGQ